MRGCLRKYKGRPRKDREVSREDEGVFGKKTREVQKKGPKTEEVQQKKGVRQQNTEVQLKGLQQEKERWGSTMEK